MTPYCPPNSFKAIAQFQHLHSTKEQQRGGMVKKRGNFNAKQ
jgi:hypothetical protein